MRPNSKLWRQVDQWRMVENAEDWKFGSGSVWFGFTGSLESFGDKSLRVVSIRCYVD